MTNGAPLVLVSNRGPVTFEDDGIGQARHRRPRHGADRPRLAPRRGLDRVGDDRRRRRASPSEHGGRAFEIEAPHGGEYHVRLVASDPEAYDRFYNIFANPMLWFIQHYLWDLCNAPDIRRHEVEAFEFGYNVVNEDLAAGGARGDRRASDEPVVMVHDYHLYTLPALVRARAAGRVPAPLRPHPVDAVRTPGACCPTQIRDEIFDGLLANDIIGFHTRSYRRNFLQCCRDLHRARGRLRARRRAVPRTARCGCARYPLPIDCARDAGGRGARRACAEFEDELLRRRREHLDPARRPRRPLEERAARVHRASTSSSSSTRSSPSGSRSSRS